jgi:hypothetical protein
MTTGNAGRKTRARVGVAAIAALVLSSACGSAASTGTTSANAGFGVTLTWSDKGHTVRVAKGTKILLKLKNTYWKVRGSSNAKVVRQTGAAKVRPAPPGQCVAGVGCGTVTAPFKAVGSGTAHIRAARSTCGEALSCSPGRGRYDVTIVVHG